MAFSYALQLGLTAAVGLGAGVLGGVAGVGGSMVMIPGLHLVHGNNPSEIHHLYMASAMLVNVAVALPAAYQHGRAGAVRRDLLPLAIAAATAGILIGVFCSNLIDGDALSALLGGAIILYCAYLAIRTARNSPEPDHASRRTSPWRVASCSALAGLTGGLLGLGGGVVLVPALQLVCRIPLRHAIATSSAVICFTALIGAGFKLATLGQHGQSIPHALLLAALMAPTAILGARIGAKLTHTLPLQWVRVLIILFLIAAAAKLMSGTLSPCPPHPPPPPARPSPA
ncbi:MAG: sulfite exporter TauE/SafE family protein [Phycisphaerales bacterium]